MGERGNRKQDNGKGKRKEGDRGGNRVGKGERKRRAPQSSPREKERRESVGGEGNDGR